MGGDPVPVKLGGSGLPHPGIVWGWDLGGILRFADGRPRSKGYFWGLGIMKVLWKTVTGILNESFMTDLKFHENIDGFMSVRGTGTASLKYKLIQQLMAMRE